MTVHEAKSAWCGNSVMSFRSPLATLGLRIRTFRRAASLSPVALSERTGIGVYNLRDYESDRMQPPDFHLAKLIEVLGEELTSGYEG